MTNIIPNPSALLENSPFTILYPKVASTKQINLNMTFTKFAFIYFC